MSNDGGPAFPRPEHLGYTQGISIRDFFAAHALSSLVRADNPATTEQYANWAYIIADALLKEREKSDA